MSHETETEFEDLARALRESRPNPEPEFTERLDQAVADHFPPEWAKDTALGARSDGGVGNFIDRLRRRIGGRRLLLPAVAGFACLLMVATLAGVVIDGDRQGTGGSETTLDLRSGGEDAQIESVDKAIPMADGALSGQTSAAPASGEGPRPVLAQAENRDVAREAEITLGTDPSGVQEVANEIVAVTDDHNGIVMNSKVTDGEEGRAGASFDLLVPSGQVESAVADLSAIADLRARSQELTDITAPTRNTEEDIADTEARIQSLLGELEEATDEDERERIERQIRWERQQKRWAENRLNRLERRVDFTPIGVRVESSGGDSSGSSWGLGDAVDDAGTLLGAAAGVTVLALAVAIPIGIVVLVALALNRAWVNRSRRRALGDED